MRLFKIAALISLVCAGTASAHEFWIDPQEFQVRPGDEIVADLRVGQEFVGNTFPYIPNNFVRFELVRDDEVVKVLSRIGDRPALHQAVPDEGLWVVVHETADFKLTYVENGIFESFVAHKDLKGTLEDHADRGLPLTGFSENYRRFAKALIAVGKGAGADHDMGMRTEIIAEKNPYADDFDGVMTVQVLFEGEPRADAQVEVFERDGTGQISIGLTRTDAQGRASFTAKPGHVYLVDAVKMLPLEGDEAGVLPVWYSLWASTTFAVPE